jgi:diguanylate cyclase (GGDEF)-like protein
MVLHQSDRTRVVSRQLSADSLVIFKEALGPDAAERADHERAMLERLAGVPGVPQLVELPVLAGPVPRGIALAGVAGTTLANVLDGERLVVTQVISMGLDLARTVGAVHRRGVIHRDICPANVIVGVRRQLTLIDFGSACGFAEERRGPGRPDEMIGTLAYMSPEQTGRTSHAVDQRSDLYSLGVTLYKSATGRLPFVDDDVLQLVHAHLARVPAPADELEPQLPQTLSRIIMRLLEKDPGNRYQSAEGLVHDLLRLQAALSQGESAAFDLRERDFAWRLQSPARLIGRAEEIGALRAAFDRSLRGDCRAVLVSGASGVGKTVLMDELRPLVTARRGYFIAGKFDQYRRDAPNAIAQSLRALGRLLLAEPQAEIDALRARILVGVGADAPILATLPEFATLLDLHAANLSPIDNAARLGLAGLALLRAVATPLRPVVMVIDDLQWASADSINFIDFVLTDPNPTPGLLLVVSWRDEKIDSTQVLAAAEPRWDRNGSALRLRLRNLPPADLAVLVGEMLRLAPEAAAQLAGALRVHSAGNPYETVELLNALRSDGTLVQSGMGWRWDAKTLRRRIGTSDVVDLLAARAARLAEGSREVLETLACVGGEIDFVSLSRAAGLSAESLDAALTPTLEDGLVVREPDGKTLRFQHDRVQQAIYGRLNETQLQMRHLAIARRLAAHEDLLSLCAEQYLTVSETLQESEEKRQVVLLFQAGAAGVGAFGNATLRERLVGAALALLASMDERPADDALRLALCADLHVALYIQGKLEEADAVYEGMQAMFTDPLQRIDPAWVQITSLSSRGRPSEAIDLGLALLPLLGVYVPASDAELDAEITARMDAVRDWIDSASPAAEALRPEITDARVLKAAKLMSRLTGPAFFDGRRKLAGWLVLQGITYWVEDGPSADLAAAVSNIALLTGPLEDYKTAYSVMRHVLEVSTARRYEPATSFARFTFISSTAHWFDPLEDSVAQSRVAREGLLHGAELQFACLTYYPSLAALIDSAPRLEECAREVREGLVLAESLHRHARGTLLVFRRLVGLLQGTPDGEGDDAELLASLSGSPMARGFFQVYRALAGALLGDDAALCRHAAAATAMLPNLGGYYHVALGHLLRGLAAASRLAGAAGEERGALLAELDASREWLASRAIDAPFNFGHLVQLLDAERAAARGDFQAALLAFDIALSDVERRGRPWQEALVRERAGRFHLEHGLPHSGRALIRSARRRYRSWGAAAIVRRLDDEFTYLPAAEARRDARSSQVVLSDSIDLLAILRASQALSSETSLERLEGRVIELLAELTGATSVAVVLRQDGTWRLRAPATSVGATGMMAADAAAALDLLSLTALRYVERTREPLLVEDAIRDNRFARDPYFAAVKQCSLLGVPVQNQGSLQAVLLLENRLRSGAFAPDRLDAVKLIAGQLAMSLNNVQLYESLERKVAERTAALELANGRLELLSNTDALTGLPNRRRLDEVLQAEWLRALRSKASIGLAMIDCDHFKSYNDHYGHLRGDSVLCSIATALRNACRMGSDFVARFGGEEFFIVMPDTDLTGAHVVAERARGAVADLCEPHAKSPRGIVTISVGCTACVPGAGASVEQYLEIADAALYRAKRAGRDRAHAAPKLPNSNVL